MNFKIFQPSLLVTILLISACDHIFLEEEIENTPIQNFEEMWREFDKKYGLFSTKGINWDSVYTVYRPQVNNDMNDRELYDVLRAMMELFDDSHVALVPTKGSYLPVYQSGVLGRLDTIHDFDLDLIKSNYLKNARFEDPFFTYGLLENNLGYIHIEGFSDLPKFLEDPFENVLGSLKETQGLIIDVRGGYGGEDVAGQYLAGRFAQKEIAYMKSRVKAGPGRNDFTPYQIWTVKPEGNYQYTKPVLVLTHRHTVSARETFCLAMKVLPNVRFIGDTTAGAFSNQINRELPNGWGYSLSIGQWTDAQGTSHEGIGLVPDMIIKNQRQEVLGGTDQALEAAMSDLMNIENK